MTTTSPASTPSASTSPTTPTRRRHHHRSTLKLAAVGAVAALCTLTATLPAAATTPTAGPTATSTATPTPARHLALPAPTGRYQVGEVSLHLVDPSRPDPWQPAVPYRELMVSVFYPTTHPGGRPAAPYMLPQAAAHFDSTTATGYLGLGTTPGQADWADTVTHAALGAPVATGRDGGLPVLLYAPGLVEPRTWGTTLVTDLASRGYVVVTVDSTYESPEVQFPDTSPARPGTLATVDLSGVTDPNAYIQKALAVRTADARFVLDRLQQLNDGQNPDVDGRRLPHGLAGALNLSEVGMFGHSLGGTAAATTMDADPRVKAGLDMDGNLNNQDGSLMPVAEHGLDRPFLLLGKDGTTDTGPGWQAFRANTPGWHAQLTLKGSEHDSFTDAEALVPQLGLPAATRTTDIGTIDPATAIHTDEAYVAAYFDHFLRGCSGRLLDGPVPQYPDMEFVR
ncbi:alpha/beta hydrolase family protein [Kitasatospora sp. LaBMicrA B282]|uniref:alpha/beta hydrolase family protein n=1 Tax=Kitasatospora sp. LaBMicrA B282 TaxID=3420949 RepID=UPI003D0DF2CD